MSFTNFVLTILSRLYIMKKNALLFAGFVALLTLYSCSKDDDIENAFTFDGKNYPINDLYLVEEIFNDGAEDELHVFQFMFTNAKAGDTTALALAVFDVASESLGGNYPSLGFVEEPERCVHPFALFFLSGIAFQDETIYLTGEGGSLDVQVSGEGTYTIEFNGISVGEYESFGDQTGYQEMGKITGSYEGPIHKTTEVMSGVKGSVKNYRHNALLDKVK